MNSMTINLKMQMQFKNFLNTQFIKTDIKKMENLNIVRFTKEIKSVLKTFP